MLERIDGKAPRQSYGKTAAIYGNSRQTDREGVGEGLREVA